MQTRTKLTTLHLIEGLCGWIWILATLALLYFLGAALFFGGSWWNVLWAFGISAVAKWLTRGFLDSRKRVAYETQLMASGMTREEARRAWVAAYTGQPPK